MSDLFHNTDAQEVPFGHTLNRFRYFIMLRFSTSRLLEPWTSIHHRHKLFDIKTALALDIISHLSKSSVSVLILAASGAISVAFSPAMIFTFINRSIYKPGLIDSGFVRKTNVRILFISNDYTSPQEVNAVSQLQWENLFHHILYFWKDYSFL